MILDYVFSRDLHNKFERDLIMRSIGEILWFQKDSDEAFAFQSIQKFFYTNDKEEIYNGFFTFVNDDEL